MRPELAITVPEVEGMLSGNDEIGALARDQLGVAMLRNLETNGRNAQWERLGGLDWQFTDGVYKPEGQPVKEYFPKDTVVVLPAEPKLKHVLAFAEGRVQIPAGPMHGSVQAALSMLKEVRGSYAYAELRTDPAGIRLYAGWFGLPVLLDPSAVLNFTVRP